jgi:molybdopterin-guanine dinucleotide biosynthesis protein A
MGSDKATLDVGGEPLGRRPIDALVAAGLDVMLVGAREEHSALPGRAVEDLWPGEGPVGAVLTSLHAAFLAGSTAVVALACDLPAVTQEAVQALVDAAGPRHVVIATVDGRRAFPNGVWPVALLPVLEDAFGEGADSFAELLAAVEVVEVDGGTAFTDADEPGDLNAFR